MLQQRSDVVDEIPEQSRLTGHMRKEDELIIQDKTNNFYLLRWSDLGVLKRKD